MGKANDVPVDPAEVQHSVQHLLARVGGPTSGLRPLAEGLEALIAAAEPILRVDCVGVLLVDEDDRLRSVASSNGSAAALERAQEGIGVGPGIDTVRTQATVTVADLLADDRYRQLEEHLRAEHVRAVVSAPVWVNGAVAGNLNAVRAAAHEWSADEITAVEAYADVVATLLQFNASAVRTAALPNSDGARGTEA